MAVAKYTLEADLDVIEISNYIAKDNLAAAIRWVDSIQDTCRLLATQPGSGELLVTVRFGETRRYVRGNYLIYYRPIAEGIEVVRVFHGARDQDRLV